MNLIYAPPNHIRYAKSGNNIYNWKPLSPSIGMSQHFPTTRRSEISYFVWQTEVLWAGWIYTYRIFKFARLMLTQSSTFAHIITDKFISLLFPSYQLLCLAENIFKISFFSQRDVQTSFIDNKVQPLSQFGTFLNLEWIGFSKVVASDRKLVDTLLK